MGFFRKLYNFVTGKGFKEDEVQKVEEVMPVETKISTVEPTQPRVKEEEQTEERQPRKTIIGTIPTKKDERTELERATDTYKKLPKRRDVESKIRSEGVNTITKKQHEPLNSNNRNDYIDLFSKDAKLTDPDILNVLIEGRHSLQHRFVIKAKFFLGGKEANILTINGALVEHAPAIEDIAQIGTVEINSPPELHQLQNSIISFFRDVFGAIDGSYTDNHLKGKLTGIEYEYSFA